MTSKLACCLLLTCAIACNRGERGIPPEKVADYLHATIEGHRATYAEQVVHRLQDVDKVIKSTQAFQEEKTLPLPSQMLRMSAQHSAKSTDFRFALISQWAINKANQPRTEFEKTALERVRDPANRSHSQYETVGGRRYFKAIYADKAVSRACIDCHNHHPESPRHDFQPGEVMGGVLISIPVD
jgi:hypothetical protein